MDVRVNAIKAYFEGRIDFRGQERVEALSRNILWSSAAIAFVIGFVLQSLRVTFAIFGVGILGCSIAVLPAWPTYNSHPIKWLPATQDSSSIDDKDLSESKKKR